MSEKPESLKDKTSKDHDYLVSRGWRRIGSKKYQYGFVYYWDHPDRDNGRGAFTQGDALALQKRLDKYGTE